MGPRGTARLTAAVAAVALAAALRTSPGGGPEEGGEGCGGLRGVTAVLGNNTHQVSGGRGGAGRGDGRTGGPGDPRTATATATARRQRGRTGRSGAGGRIERGGEGQTEPGAPTGLGGGRTDGRGALRRLPRCRRRSVAEPGRAAGRTDGRTAARGGPVLPGWDGRTDRQLRHAPLDGQPGGRTHGQPRPAVRGAPIRPPPPLPTASSATAPRRVRPLCRPGRSLIAANWHPGTGAAGTHRERGVGTRLLRSAVSAPCPRRGRRSAGGRFHPFPFPPFPPPCRGGAGRRCPAGRCLGNGDGGGGLISSPS